MKKALILVDLQNDFMPGGALGIPEGDQILPKINQLQKEPFDYIVATKDWHPKDHCSFSQWPPHCIQNTKGSEFAPGLNLKKIEKVFYKGTDPDCDSYSTFFDNEHKHATTLDQYLKERQVLEIYFAGLATEYCVRYSALDALDLGYTVYIISDACKPINPEEGKKTLLELSEKGAKIITAQEIL